MHIGPSQYIHRVHTWWIINTFCVRRACYHDIVRNIIHLSERRAAVKNSQNYDLRTDSGRKKYCASFCRLKTLKNAVLRQFQSVRHFEGFFRVNLKKTRKRPKTMLRTYGITIWALIPVAQDAAHLSGETRKKKNVLFVRKPYVKLVMCGSKTQNMCILHVTHTFTES